MKLFDSSFFSIFLITKFINPSIKLFLSIKIIFSISSSFISFKSNNTFNLPKERDKFSVSLGIFISKFSILNSLRYICGFNLITFLVEIDS